MTTVGVAIPTIPPRRDMLHRAIASVTAQTHVPDAVSIAVDHAHQGAAYTRNRAWRALDTDWVAFLDDDDELLPHHIEVCRTLGEEVDAHLVYPWFEVVGGSDPFPDNFGRPWTPGLRPQQTTIVALWHRAALIEIGGFAEVDDAVDEEGNRVGEDAHAVYELDRLGGKIVHLPERTWLWHHHGGNTSGLGFRW